MLLSGFSLGTTENLLFLFSKNYEDVRFTGTRNGLHKVNIQGQTNKDIPGT